MLVDANVLIAAVDRSNRHHAQAAEWLTEQLNGPTRVGLPWPSLLAFLRITTHPRAFARPLDAATAWKQITDWLAPSVAWIPGPGPTHAEILGRLVTTHGTTGNLVPDVHLAALAIEHGLVVASADTDFARFPDVRWVNPLA